MTQEKTNHFELTSRISKGTLGQPIMLISNHYKVSYDTDKMIYSYYLSINQVNPHGDQGLPITAGNQRCGGNVVNSNAHKIKTEMNNREVLRKAVEVNSGEGGIFNNIAYIYDGVSCIYTSDMLPTIDDKLTKLLITLGKEENNGNGNEMVKNYEISLKMVNRHLLQILQEFNKNPLDEEHSEMIRLINLAVRHLFLTMRFLVGRSSFYTPSKDDVRYSISTLKEISYGIFSSVQACSSGLQLILDRTCALFLKPYTLDQCIMLIMRECGAQRWNDFVRRKLETIVKDYQFEVSHLPNPRKYRIFGLTLESANKITFVNSQENNRITNVAEYFSKVYQPLKWPDLACIKVRRGKNDFIYFPAEVCRLVPDQKVKKMSTKEKVDMIRNAAAILPSERFEIINTNAQELIYYGKESNYLPDFGINVSEKPVIIGARVLEASTLVGGDDELPVSAGRWRITKFYKPAKLTNWVLIKMISIDEPNVDKFLEMIMRTGESFGMTVAQPKRIEYSFEQKTLESLFSNIVQCFGKVDLVFFIGCDIEQQYNAIKKIGDVDYGISTQCMRQTNVNRMNASIATNVLQKINIKLGGVNVSTIREKLPTFMANNYEKLMVVGVDVIHPSLANVTKTSRRPSIAALVANYTPDFTRYIASVKVQKYFRQEIIQELDKMILELLVAYETKVKTLPDRIVIYRDGVSESQFRTVFDEEVRLIKEALNRYRGEYQPKLTFIVVQKRHHTRFIPDNTEDGVGKGCNVPPGTVVDTEVVNSKNFDFYLCSHTGIQGTSRPSHYCVLLDENEMSADDIQTLTNHLCHLYACCSRSISIPTPVYYAHLAASRARSHIQAILQQRLIDNAGGDYSSRPGRDYFTYESTTASAAFDNNSNSSNNNNNTHVQYTRHRLPQVDNFDSYIEMSLERRCSMYFC